MIRKKINTGSGQSSTAVRKSAGVSYVKPSESRQLRVKHEYEPLAPTVFQCSYNLQMLSDMRPIEYLFDKLF